MPRWISLLSRPWGELLALVAGCVFPLAFAPFEWRPLGWLSLLLLFLSWWQVSPRRAFLRGWLWGLGAFLVGVSWVYNSMHNFGGAPVLAAAIFTLCFCFYLALYPALTGWLWRRYFNAAPGVLAALALGLLWAGTEWLRAWVLTGFPWLLSGFALLDTPFEGYMPVIGALGAGGASAATVALLLLALLNKRWSGVVAAAAIVALGAGLGQLSWQSESQTESVDVALVQGNIPQELKLQSAYLNLSLQTYYKLSEPHWDADLVLWPETAMPTYRSVVEGFLQNVARRTEQHDVAVYTGIFFRAENGRDYYNAMLEVGGDWQVYKKHQLVPFGEYMPVRWLMKLFSAFVDIPQSDMATAPLSSDPVVLGGVPVSSSICYEMAYPDVLRAQLPAAGLMVNTSNDAWFGDSFAPHQHLEMARARAREFARPIARSTNTGVTAMIDARGQVLDVLPQFQPGVLRGRLQTNTVATPFTFVGQWPVGVTALLLALVAGFGLARFGVRSVLESRTAYSPENSD